MKEEINRIIDYFTGMITEELSEHKFSPDEWQIRLNTVEELLRQFIKRYIEIIFNI